MNGTHIAASYRGKDFDPWSSNWSIVSACHTEIEGGGVYLAIHSQYDHLLSSFRRITGDAPHDAPFTVTAASVHAIYVVACGCRSFACFFSLFLRILIFLNVRL